MRRQPRSSIRTPRLSPDGRVQLFLFQQFLLLFLLTPTTGAMALAAHAVVGEKQARTLEPLLATPITTFELLLAKVLGALVPTLVIAMAGLALYVAGIALLALPGVLGAMIEPADRRPGAAGRPGGGARVAAGGDPHLVARERCAHRAAVRRLHRHSGQRAARRPVHRRGLAVGLRPDRIGAAMLLLWAILAAVSVRLFDRETILTRWR